MKVRGEEDPDPDEEPEVMAPAPATPVVSGPGGGREYEYRTELLTAAQVTDGRTLPEKLTKVSSDGWDLVEVLVAGDRHVLLLRKPKRAAPGGRRVGFAPPDGAQV